MFSKNQILARNQLKSVAQVVLIKRLFNKYILTVLSLFVKLELLAEPRVALSQWETSLQSNAACHWLGANLEPALNWCRIWSTRISY